MRNLIRVFHLANETVNATVNSTANKATTPPAKSHGLSGKAIFFIVLASILVLIMIVYLIWGCIKKKRLYEDYNKRPETFIRKPSFTLLDTILNTQHTFEAMKYHNVQSNKIHVSLKKELTTGPLYEICFPNTMGLWCSVKYSLLLENTCYFQVEILGKNGEIVIGYGHADEVERLFNRADDISRAGIGFSSLGIVRNKGMDVYNYNLKPKYGDVIGIGITKSDYRVWFTYNGQLLNEPTSSQQQRWFRQNLEKDLQKENRPQKQSFLDKLLKRTKKKQAPLSQKAAMESKFKKNDIQLTKQKVTLNYSLFGFHAFISCYTGQEDGFNIFANTGGQVFRFPQHQFKEGLYKQSDEQQDVEIDQEGEDDEQN